MSEPFEVSTILWQGAALGDWRFRHARPNRERLIAMPNSTEIRQLLPWRASSIIATARRRSDERPVRREWRDAIGVAGLLTVGAMTKSRRLGIEHRGSLIEHVASTLGHPTLSGIVLCGPQRANQKPVIQLHDRRGRTFGYVKVAWNGLTRRLLQDECAALTHLGAIPDKGFSVPPVLATGTYGDADWLALGPIAVDRRVRPDLRQVDTVAGAIERTWTSWEGRTADADYVARLADTATGLAQGKGAVERLIERRSDHTIRLGASHGDFVPWNMLSGSPEPAVWDWERYRTAAPIGFDRLHLRAQIGLHRERAPLPDVLRRLGRELDDVLPDLPEPQRQAQFDWYVADLLCRYERDVEDHLTRLTKLVTDLSDFMKERQASI